MTEHGGHADEGLIETPPDLFWGNWVSLVHSLGLRIQQISLRGGHSPDVDTAIWVRKLLVCADTRIWQQLGKDSIGTTENTL